MYEFQPVFNINLMQSRQQGSVTEVIFVKFISPLVEVVFVF